MSTDTGRKHLFNATEQEGGRTGGSPEDSTGSTKPSEADPATGKWWAVSHNLCSRVCHTANDLFTYQG